MALLTSTTALSDSLPVFSVSRINTGQEDAIKITLKNDTIKSHHGLADRVMSEVERKLVDFSIKQFGPVIRKYIKKAILANSTTMKDDSEAIAIETTDNITFANDLINTYKDDPDAV